MTKVINVAPRIALVHALFESIEPIHTAFTSLWPQPHVFDLFDGSLAPDLQAYGELNQAIDRRISMLAEYAAESEGAGGRTAAILFTCSAFGPAIDRVKRSLPIPVLRPNEAAFEHALGLGNRIGLIVTFPPSLAALEQELHEMASALGRKVEVEPVLAQGALAALKAGDTVRHDELVAEAASRLTNVDAVVLGQFSAARAAAAVGTALPSCPVLTTPAAAVEALRTRLAPAVTGFERKR